MDQSENSYATPAPEPKPFANALKWFLALLGAVGAMVLVDTISLAAFILFLVVHYGSYETGIAILDAGPITSDVASTLAMQLLSLVVFVPWYLALRRCSVFRAKRLGQEHTSAGQVAKRIAGIVLLGIGLEFLVSYVLAIVITLLPSVGDMYSDVSESLQSSSETLIGGISGSILAPLYEETLVRGIFFEFALRLVQPRFPAWRAKAYPEKRCAPQCRPEVSSAAFWVANVIQALLFGVIHGNVVQGSYAFVLGLVFGVVAWRTGSIRYSILLHMAVNSSGYLLEFLPNEMEWIFAVVLMLVAIVVSIVGKRLYWGATEAAQKPVHSSKHMRTA